MNISSNISSLQANQTFANNNAHNIANVNSDGFIPTNTTISQSTPSSVTANSTPADDTQSTKSQTDLSKELTDQVTIENVQGANVAAIKTQNELFGTLLDIKA